MKADQITDKYNRSLQSLLDEFQKTFNEQQKQIHHLDNVIVSLEQQLAELKK